VPHDIPPKGRGGSTPPRPVSGGGPQQWFVLRPWLFDVTATMDLLRCAPPAAPCHGWARAFGMIPSLGSSPPSVPLQGDAPDTCS